MAPLDCGIFFLFLRFSSEIERFPMKFPCDSREIAVFQGALNIAKIQHHTVEKSAGSKLKISARRHFPAQIS
jgi:hypothetical protein